MNAGGYKLFIRRLEEDYFCIMFAYLFNNFVFLMNAMAWLFFNYFPLLYLGF